MKHLLYALFLSLIMGASFAGEARIEAFDGIDRPIEGPFGEPIPKEFFSQDLTKHFMDRQNYNAYFKLLDTGEKSDEVIAYIINEFDGSNDVVFSAVSLKEAKVKNFLVRVQQGGVGEIDVSGLAGYDHVLVMSLVPFSLQFDTFVGTEKNTTNQPIVQPPLPYEPEFEEPDAKRADCFSYVGAFNIRISNRSPSTPGSVNASAHMGYNIAFGNLFLQIRYPINGPVFHSPANPRPSCSSTTTPVDKYYTNSANGRYVRWVGMQSLLAGGIFASGKAYCESPTSGSNSCIVVGTTTKASWNISRIN